MNNTLTLRRRRQPARDTRLVFELLDEAAGGMLEVAPARRFQRACSATASTASRHAGA